MERNLSSSHVNVGHMHGGGTGGQLIMGVLRASASRDVADISAILWALNTVAGPGDSVIMLGVVHELKKICPKMPFRNTLGYMCNRVFPNVPEFSMRKRIVEAQIAKTKENYRKQFRDLEEPCKAKGVKLDLEIIATAGQSLRHVTVQQAVARKVEWVILDRQLKRLRHYFMKRIPCNLVLMTESNEGSILKLGPGWSFRRGDCCTEACSAHEKPFVSGLLLPDPERDKGNIAEDSSDCTGSGDSDLSSHGDKCPAEQRVSEEIIRAVARDLIGIRGELPRLTLVQERHEGETSSDDDSFGTPLDSPQWSSGDGSLDHEHEQSSLSEATRATNIGGVLSLPLCSECKHKIPDFGPPKQLSLQEILEATDSFSSKNHLADCKLGKVYKGFLPDGQAVSVKRLHRDSDTFRGDKYFHSEIDILSLAHHVNVVTLVGYCTDNEERILVFEYACNKALSWHLSPLNIVTLSWRTRRKIALETARALRYLHEECRAGSIVHGSVEVNSVLLTHDYSPVVCNFNRAVLRRHCDEAPKGRSEPVRTGSITTMSDVYCFGILLLELLIGGTATDSNVERIAPEEPSVVDSIRRQLEKGCAYSLVDPALEENYDDYELYCMIQAASHCLQTDRSMRPPMSKILSVLLGNPREDEIGDNITREGSSCDQVTARSPFLIISGGVKVF